MLNAISALVMLSALVLAMLVMFQRVSLSDLFSMTRRGLIAIVAFMVLFCLAKQLLFGMVLPALPGLIVGVASIVGIILGLLLLLLLAHFVLTLKNRRSHGED